MAQLLLINAITKRDVNEIGDIVGVFDDEHIFSENEYHSFEIVKIEGKREEINSELEKLIPEDYKTAIRFQASESARLMIAIEESKDLNGNPDPTLVEELRTVMKSVDDNFIIPKYKNRVTDKAATEISKMCSTKIIAKVK